MDSKLLISIVVVVVFVITFFAYSSFNQPGPEPAAGQDEQAKLLGGADRIEVFEGRIAGITEDGLTLTTNNGVLTLKKSPATRYAELSDGSSKAISESELKQDDQATIVAGSNTQTGEFTALSVTVTGS